MKILKQLILIITQYSFKTRRQHANSNTAAGCAGVPAARVKQEEQTDALSCAHLGWCEIALAPPPRLNRFASRSLSKLTKTLAECREVFPQLLIIQQHARDEKTGFSLCSSDALRNYRTYAGESKPHTEDTTQSAAHAICLI
jgi:hypothetical protein